jgi:hypothetical protein
MWWQALDFTGNIAFSHTSSLHIQHQESCERRSWCWLSQ